MITPVPALWPLICHSSYAKKKSRYISRWRKNLALSIEYWLSRHAECRSYQVIEGSDKVPENIQWGYSICRRNVFVKIFYPRVWSMKLWGWSITYIGDPELPQTNQGISIFYEKKILLEHGQSHLLTWKQNFHQGRLQVLSSACQRKAYLCLCLHGCRVGSVWVYWSSDHHIIISFGCQIWSWKISCLPAGLLIYLMYMVFSLDGCLYITCMPDVCWGQ